MTLKAPPKSAKGYLRSRGWKDLTFVCIVALLAVLARHYLPSERSDYEKWQARPKLDFRATAITRDGGQNGLPPCLFIVAPSVVNQPIVSGDVGDCLQLVPDGRNLNLIEIALGGGVIPIKTDLYIPDIIPLAFTRTYLPLNDWSKRFEVYLPHVYDLFLTGSRQPYTYLDWSLPDQQSIHYKRISPGTGYGDAIFEDVSFSPVFEGSRISWNGFGWDLALVEGTTYLSPEAYSATRPQQGSLVGIFDNEGNEVRLSRKNNGDLEEVKSPSGKWIRFRYKDGLMVEAKDSAGDIVEYRFDNANRLEAARYTDGRMTSYMYDGSDRVTRIEDRSEEFVLKIKYDSQGKVAEATVNDGLTYQFRYTFVFKDSKSLDVDVINPKGGTTRVRIQVSGSRISYTIEKQNYDSGSR
jgi:YD repeat-containing protein